MRNGTEFHFIFSWWWWMMVPRCVIIVIIIIIIARARLLPYVAVKRWNLHKSNLPSTRGIEQEEWEMTDGQRQDGLPWMFLRLQMTIERCLFISKLGHRCFVTWWCDSFTKLQCRNKWPNDICGDGHFDTVQSVLFPIQVVTDISWTVKGQQN